MVARGGKMVRNVNEDNGHLLHTDGEGRHRRWCD